MASLAAVLLTALKLEDDDLLSATLGDNLTRDLGSLNERRAKLGAVAAKEKNFVERYFVAGGALELFNSKKIALCDSVLLAARADNCVCHGEGARKLDPRMGGRKEVAALPA